jgi:hypothetical protein
MDAGFHVVKKYLTFFKLCAYGGSKSIRLTYMIYCSMFGLELLGGRQPGAKPQESFTGSGRPWTDLFLVTGSVATACSMRRRNSYPRLVTCAGYNGRRIRPSSKPGSCARRRLGKCPTAAFHQGKRPMGVGRRLLILLDSADLMNVTESSNNSTCRRRSPWSQAS